MVHAGPRPQYIYSQEVLLSSLHCRYLLPLVTESSNQYRQTLRQPPTVLYLPLTHQPEGPVRSPCFSPAPAYSLHSFSITTEGKKERKRRMKAWKRKTGIEKMLETRISQ